MTCQVFCFFCLVILLFCFSECWAECVSGKTTNLCHEKPWLLKHYFCPSLCFITLWPLVLHKLKFTLQNLWIMSHCSYIRQSFFLPNGIISLSDSSHKRIYTERWIKQDRASCLWSQATFNSSRPQTDELTSGAVTALLYGRIELSWEAVFCLFFPLWYVLPAPLRKMLLFGRQSSQCARTWGGECCVFWLGEREERYRRWFKQKVWILPSGR